MTLRAMPNAVVVGGTTAGADVTVKPTIQGIASGRDEVLEAAKRVIQEQK